MAKTMMQMVKDEDIPSGRDRWSHSKITQSVKKDLINFFMSSSHPKVKKFRAARKSYAAKGGDSTWFNLLNIIWIYPENFKWLLDANVSKEAKSSIKQSLKKFGLKEEAMPTKTYKDFVMTEAKKDPEQEFLKNMSRVLDKQEIATLKKIMLRGTGFVDFADLLGRKGFDTEKIHNIVKTVKEPKGKIQAVVKKMSTIPGVQRFIFKGG